MTKIFSYKVARDFGFAPNPFGGHCTLACCKPKIRKVAQVGDWVVGGGSAKNKLRHKIIFAMCISEIITFDEFYLDKRFQMKKPNIHSSHKHFFGDNIYHQVTEKRSAIQSNSHHSHYDGTANRANLTRDISVNRVLVSDDFVYFGSKAIEPPQDLQNYQGHDFPTDCRDFYYNYPQDFPPKVISWLRSLNDWGYVGRPAAWDANIHIRKG